MAKNPQHIAIVATVTRQITFSFFPNDDVDMAVIRQKFAAGELSAELADAADGHEEEIRDDDDRLIGTVTAEETLHEAVTDVMATVEQAEPETAD